jgi:plasmid stabilization system protein ParE
VRHLVVRPAAANDLTSAYRWYEERRLGLGEELLLEVQAAIERMLLLPLSFPVVHRETRRALIRRFPYGVFFRLDGDTVIVVAVYHLRRNPRLWMQRR